ncbi:MAG: 30S ribosomal protein S9 [Candidatus Woesearchaeota archaeon]|nr:30S ribosomal protein S9 [Candidatus Woesearchaeota archaeon]
MKPLQFSGKRKTAIARATLVEGTGRLSLNNAPIETVTPEILRMKILEPIIIAGDSAKKVDIKVTVHGGGINGRADAARLAIAKSLAAYNPALKEEFQRYDRHLLVADVRHKEAKKPNRHGNARGKVQKSYR